MAPDQAGTFCVGVDEEKGPGVVGWKWFDSQEGGVYSARRLPPLLGCLCWRHRVRRETEEGVVDAEPRSEVEHAARGRIRDAR